MKTTKTVLAAITNTISLREIVLMILFNIALSCFGQQVKGNQEYIFENTEVTEYELTSFKCTPVEGKVYIIWTVSESSNECVYILERSIDNKKYYRIHSEKGAKSPNGVELINSFIDEKPFNGTSYYRVRRLTKRNEMTSNAYVVNGIVSDYSLYADLKQ